MPHIDIPAERCFGCSACVSVCPHDAIVMRPDVMGFLFPNVDTSKCTDCGLCERSCPSIKRPALDGRIERPLIYAARHKDMREVETSRSGAVFVALSDCVLNDGGSVYGAALTDDMKIAHCRAVDRAGRDRFKGSKYVQSDMGHIFNEIKKELKAGRSVMFSGTPCQTAGLNSFLSDSLKKRLTLVDIVCHGVPAPGIWDDYLRYIRKKYGKKVTGVDFRNKKYGWAAHVGTISLKCGESIDSILFRDLFFAGLIVRKSCFSCPFANTYRPADITLGDFWGWEKLGIDINKDDKGLSLVICNTEKGKNLLAVAGDMLTTYETSVDMCLQPNLVSPTKEPEDRTGFEEYYGKNGFKAALEKYGFVKPERNIMERIKQIIKIR